MALTTFEFCGVNGDLRIPYAVDAQAESVAPSSSAQATTLTSSSAHNVCRVATDTAVYVSFGASPDAGSDTTRVLIPANTVALLRIPSEVKASAITVGAVAPPPDATNDTPPSIASTFPNESFTATPGVWSNASSVAGQWYAGGAAIPGETGTTLTLVGLTYAGDDIFYRETALPGGATADSASIRNYTPITAATDGMSSAGTFPPGAGIPGGQNSLSFSMDVTLSGSEDGVLFEDGGASDQGVILYETGGVLYFQAGDGTAFGSAADRGEIVWPVMPGSMSIEGSAARNSGIAMYINGHLVGSDQFTGPLMGSENGRVGGINISAAVNRGGFSVNGMSEGHAEAGSLRVFLGQTTGDEAG